MLPAEQCFHADQLVVFQVYEGLVKNHELVVFHGLAQAGFHKQEFKGPRVHVRCVVLVVVLSCILGPVKGCICTAKQDILVLSIIRI